MLLQNINGGILMKKLSIILLIASLFLMSCQSPYYTSGKVYLQQQNYEKAAEQFQLEVDSNPANSDAWYKLAGCRAELGQYEQAYPAYQKAKELDPKLAEEIDQQVTYYWSEIYNRAVRYHQAGQPEKALEQFELSLKMDPKAFNSYKNMAIVYGSMQQMEKMAEYYQKALEIDPTADEIYYNLSVYHMQNDDTENAIKMMAKGIEYAPKRAEYHSMMAQLLMAKASKIEDMEAKQAAFGEVAVAYEKAIECDTTQNYGYRYDAGYAAFLAKDYEKSLEMYLKAYEIDANHPDFGIDLLNNIVSSLMMLKRWEEQLPYLEKWQEIEPENPDVYNLAGQVYNEMSKEAKAAGDNGKAKELLDEAMSYFKQAEQYE